MLSTQKFHTFRMGKKARSVTIGDRGSEAIFLTPKPKPVVEINTWVLVVKLRTGLLIALALLLGGLGGLLAWHMGGLDGAWLFVGFMGVGFLVGFLMPGDRETSP